MKLFTKAIDKQLFEQYKYGSDLSRQKVVAKIFNPYGRGVWYLLNSDPADPDYIWAIVDLFSVEIGSVSRSELETVRVPPFRLPLERDMSFDPIPADQLYAGVMSGKRYEEGGLFESDEDDDEDDDEGREDGDNARMLQNQVKSIIHHAKELSEITDDIDKVEPWVITKAQRAATDLADITHYLDGNKGKYAKGGQLELFPPEMDDFNAWWEPKGSKPLSEYVYDNPVVKILIGPEGKEQFGVSYTSAEDAWAYIRSYMRGFWDEPSRFAIKVPGEVLKIVKKTVMEDGGIMAKGGVMYPNLSDMPTNVVNEPTEKEKKRGVLEKNVPEIDIKLTKTEKLTNIQIRSSDDAEQAFRRIWDVDSMYVQESMYVLYLNQANRIIGYSHHSIGGITGTVLDIQIVAATAVKALAKGIIVAHNHPSGNLLPSTSDIQISEKLKQALKLFEIRLVDSMILVPQQGHTSLVDEGRLADGGITEVKYQIVNNEGKYYSQSMTSYKPVFNASPYMGYTYTMDEAEKLIKQLEQQGYEGLQIVKYQSSFFDMADGGMMARGGKLLENYREELEAMSDEELAKEVYNEIGIDEEEAMQSMDDERDDYIEELLSRFKKGMKSRGEMAHGGKLSKGGVPTQVGQIVRFHTPNPDENPDDLYQVTEIKDDPVRPRVDIVLMDSKLAYPPRLTVSLHDLEVVNMAEGGMMAKGDKIEVGDILILPKNMLKESVLSIKDKIANNQKIPTTKWVVKNIYINSNGSKRIVINNSKLEFTTIFDEVEKIHNYIKYGVQFIDGGMMAKGGKTDFNTLAEKIAASYEGKMVKPAYQHKYGKRYDKEEAMQVGRATAAVIERRKGRM